MDQLGFAKSRMFFNYEKTQTLNALKSVVSLAKFDEAPVPNKLNKTLSATSHLVCRVIGPGSLVRSKWL